jgi:DNA-directed RNA polymerase subunit D
MHVQVLGKTDEEIRMVVDGVNPQFANSLRRIMISRIPTLAVDYVDFSKNDSVLYDEMISHRLGMLALKFDQKALDAKDVCECEGKGCANCQVVFALSKKGPCMVYASDLKSSDKEISEVVHPETPIVELMPGQELKLQAVASLGTGEDHAKHQSAHVFFRQYPKIKINGNVPENIVSVCPKHALSISGSKAAVTIDCDLCQECVHASGGKLEVTGDAEKFIFVIESISGLPAEKILLSSLDVLKGEAKEFGKQVGKLK